MIQNGRLTHGLHRWPSGCFSSGPPCTILSRSTMPLSGVVTVSGRVLGSRW